MLNFFFYIFKVAQKQKFPKETFANKIDVFY